VDIKSVDNVHKSVNNLHWFILPVGIYVGSLYHILFYVTNVNSVRMFYVDTENL
jgi:hypothetical protein